MLHSAALEEKHQVAVRSDLLNVDPPLRDPAEKFVGLRRWLQQGCPDLAERDRARACASCNFETSLATLSLLWEVGVSRCCR